MDKQKALVVFSGGQDSTTCLAWATKNFEEVEAITFNYGQRHAPELMCARAICQQVGISQKVIDMRFFGELSTSALTSSGDVSAAHPLNDKLPASFVPNRNMMFTTVAHSWAQTIGAQALVLGVCETDYSGYPDCRLPFVTGSQHILNMSSETDITIHTPLMRLSKAQTFELAVNLGALDMVLEMSHTCYEGTRTVRHEWGYGCGTCPACELRSNGWKEFSCAEQ